MREGLGFTILEFPDEVLLAGFRIDLDEHAAAAGVFQNELAGDAGSMYGIFLLDGFHCDFKFSIFQVRAKAC
jgi:hypothetical protein